MVSPDAPRATGDEVIAPGRPVASLDQQFDGDSLFGLRAAVAAHASEFGLIGGRVGELVLIANELASNAVRHGGGRGRLRLWQTDGAVHCEVTDSGPGLPNPDEAGQHRAAIGALDGRGLWIVRQLSDSVIVACDAGGTCVTVRFHLAEPVDRET